MDEVFQQLTAPSGTWSPSLYDPRQARLSRITEYSEPASRPTSRHYHARAATDSTLPPPGRANALIAQFETTSSSRPSSPTKSDSRSLSSLGLRSPRPYTPTNTNTNTFTNTFTPETFTGTFSPGSYSQSPSTFTNTYSTAFTPTTTQSYATTPSYTASTSTPTPTTPLRRNTSPRSPLASVRNIVALWKQRSPSGSPKSLPASPPPTEGLFGIRRRARDHAQQSPSRDVNIAASDAASIRTRSSGRHSLSASFDISEFSPFTQSNEPVS